MTNIYQKPYALLLIIDLMRGKLFITVFQLAPISCHLFHRLAQWVSNEQEQKEQQEIRHSSPTNISVISQQRCIIMIHMLVCKKYLKIMKIIKMKVLVSPHSESHLAQNIYIPLTLIIWPPAQMSSSTPSLAEFSNPRSLH